MKLLTDYRARLYKHLHLRHELSRHGKNLTGFGKIVIIHPVTDARLYESIDDPIFKLYCAWKDQLSENTNHT